MDESTTEPWLEALEANSVDTWTWHVAKLGKANVVMFSSGAGDGFYASWWGFAADGRLVELVTDFEILLGPVAEEIELPLPLAPGRVRHPFLEEHDVQIEALAESMTVTGSGMSELALSDGSQLEVTAQGNDRHFTWKPAAPGIRLIVSVVVGAGPLDPL